ncbi:hypothetical protein QTI24_24235 [Variovorax sp. J22P240]|uniref:hypothetical protein n=1 Tax=Variovorax sp. J22P240 TaxID=3053514 RepID=UPI00257706B0|nr:hypothetical protein [Variovorax sp. J22P240]MDM0001738.1 hypothetical protein [Variovorax sp. J22P240]
MAQTFYSAEECRAALNEVLGAQEGGRRGAMATEVADALLQDMARAARTQDADDLEVKLGSWAIRNDEIDLLVLVKDGVIAYLDGKPGSWVSLAVTLARQLLVLYRKGVRLTPEQARVLTELKRERGPRSAAELSAALSQDEPALRLALESLAAAPARAGPVKLAEKLPDGRWTVHA